MKAFRLLVVAAAVAVPSFLAGGASAECVETRELTPLRVEAEACVGEHGCVVYQTSESLVHDQADVCLFPIPAQ